MYYGIKTSGQLKKEALEKLKGKWPIAIVVYIIYSIITVSLFVDLGNLDKLVNEYLSGVSFLNFYRVILNKLSIFNTFNDKPLSIIILIVTLIISGPLLLGISRFFLKISRGEDGKIKDLFFAFTDFQYFISAFILSLLMDIFIVLWGLLLIIPGIIAAIRYSMAFYILSDTPEIGAMEAINRSKGMMDGNKERYFTLQFSFIGWYIICVLTVCVGRIFVSPYLNTAQAQFYEELKEQ